MRKFVLYGVGMLIASAMACTSVLAAGIGEGKSYHGPTGLQLYSLRNQFKQQGVAPCWTKFAIGASSTSKSPVPTE